MKAIIKFAFFAYNNLINTLISGMHFQTVSTNSSPREFSIKVCRNLLAFFKSRTLPCEAAHGRLRKTREIYCLDGATSTS